MQEMLKNLYQHVTSKDDLAKEVNKRAEEQRNQKVAQAQQAASVQTGTSKLKAHEMGLFKYDEVTYLEDFKNNINFSYMQSMALIAAYICGINKESSDLRMFEKSMQHKQRNVKLSKKGDG